MMKSREFLRPRPASLSLFAIPIVLMIVGAGCATSKPAKQELSKEEKAGLLIGVANGALIEGDVVGALRSLTEAEKLDPNRADLYHSKALVFHTRGELPEALRNAKKALELEPNFTEAKNTLGKILIDLSKYAEAEKPLLQAAADPLYRHADKANTNLGILYYRTGLDSKAEKHFSDAAKTPSATGCIANYYLGHLHLKRGQFEKAARSYDRAIQKICASFSEAHLALGIAYKRNHQFDKARRKFLEINEAFAGTQVAEQAMAQLKEIP